ncbi:MAG TPA: hypothetical protein EYG16_02155 [Deltaproteobacteria bacterium]|nr:hypothetical protein [Candidatus Binatota bacterium]HIL12456.1 hypothetical protein [Deltaproteobacteria bacterium]
MEQTKKSRQAGVALILVVWTFAALSVMAAEFARAMREDARRAGNFERSTRARYVGVAAVNEVLLLLTERAGKSRRNRSKDEEEEEEQVGPLDMLVQGDGQWVRSRFLGHPCEVRVSDEGGKLALNAIDREAVEEIMMNLGYTELEAETVADSIADWRDGDDLHRVNGAEDQYYESLSRPYVAKNGPFDSLEELLLVRGVSPFVFYGDSELPGLRDIFSVYHDSKRLNSSTVPAAVMMALSGVEKEEAWGFSDERAVEGRDVPPALRELLDGGAVSARPSAMRVVTVEARVKERGGRVLGHVSTVVKLGGRGDGFQALRWNDVIFSRPGFGDDRGGPDEAGLGQVAG